MWTLGPALAFVPRGIWRLARPAAGPFTGPPMAPCISPGNLGHSSAWLASSGAFRSRRLRLPLRSGPDGACRPGCKPRLRRRFGPGLRSPRRRSCRFAIQRPRDSLRSRSCWPRCSGAIPPTTRSRACAGASTWHFADSRGSGSRRRCRRGHRNTGGPPTRGPSPGHRSAGPRHRGPTRVEDISSNQTPGPGIPGRINTLHADGDDVVPVGRIARCRHP